MSQLYRTLTGQSQKSQQSHQSDISTQPPATLTRTTTADPLTGTLNHLTPFQEEKLKEFKERLLKGGWWTPDGVNGRASHDDGTLLRYLRARKFDVNGAFGQFTDTEKWLKEQRVEELYAHFDVEAYEKARLMYPQWTGHRDKRGIPIYVYAIKGLDNKNVQKYQKESQAYKDSLPYHKTLATPAKLLPLFALYQNLLNFVMPLVSTLERPNPEVPVTNSTNIVDISGVGLTQFWNLKGHMQDASVLATAHYPETLDRIFIIGAPSFFPTVWGWIKRWFDPVTVSKIFILGKHEVKSTLSKFMEPKDFPKRYGGDLEWDWGDFPDLDAETRAAVEKDGNKGWVQGPCLWLQGQRLVVGSVKGKPRCPDDEVEKRRPIVCAADYTETPVHPDKKMSRASHPHENMANGTDATHHRAEEAAVEAGTDGATAANLIARESNSEHQPTSPTHESHHHHHHHHLHHPHHQNHHPRPHAPSQPQPGPVPAHAVAMTQAVAAKLADESVSTVPATANGHTGSAEEAQLEVLVASDPSKGLAIEAERLTLAEDGKENGNGRVDKEGNIQIERPPIERFVTATEV
ncbi:hypothetical protein A1O1_08727 [Capronia coronata CBS 617.96]|uniref:CRAL-TRIO domain-containing protein n=1 Tax=Capronia coronata CBS 617.96 TaxID=1182541 RepID=W9XUA1_9EURO|nr:uncharacterized protein A1O1_08727 [Capronia coronata CBS 617.96]EXJ80581.1 hypothetical protein A1O1_08727 [Capronia coronata CBS 617.96]